MCTSCKSGYFFSYDVGTHSCEQCSIFLDQCSECSSTTGFSSEVECITCSGGYFVLNGKCVRCSETDSFEVFKACYEDGTISSIDLIADIDISSPVSTRAEISGFIYVYGNGYTITNSNGDFLPSETSLNFFDVVFRTTKEILYFSSDSMNLILIGCTVTVEKDSTFVVVDSNTNLGVFLDDCDVLNYGEFLSVSGVRRSTFDITLTIKGGHFYQYEDSQPLGHEGTMVLDEDATLIVDGYNDTIGIGTIAPSVHIKYANIIVKKGIGIKIVDTDLTIYIYTEANFYIIGEECIGVQIESSTDEVEFLEIGVGYLSIHVLKGIGINSTESAVSFHSFLLLDLYVLDGIGIAALEADFFAADHHIRTVGENSVGVVVTKSISFSDDVSIISEGGYGLYVSGDDYVRVTVDFSNAMFEILAFGGVGILYEKILVLQCSEIDQTYSIETYSGVGIFVGPYVDLERCGKKWGVSVYGGIGIKFDSPYNVDVEFNYMNIESGIGIEITKPPAFLYANIKGDFDILGGTGVVIKEAADGTTTFDFENSIFQINNGVGVEVTSNNNNVVILQLGTMYIENFSTAIYSEDTYTSISGFLYGTDSSLITCSMGTIEVTGFNFFELTKSYGIISDECDVRIVPTSDSSILAVESTVFKMINDGYIYLDGMNAFLCCESHYFVGLDVGGSFSNMELVLSDYSVGFEITTLNSEHISLVFEGNIISSVDKFGPLVFSVGSIKNQIGINLKENVFEGIQIASIQDGAVLGGTPYLTFDGDNIVSSSGAREPLIALEKFSITSTTNGVTVVVNSEKGIVCEDCEINLSNLDLSVVSENNIPGIIGIMSLKGTINLVDSVVTVSGGSYQTGIEILDHDFDTFQDVVFNTTNENFSGNSAVNITYVENVSFNGCQFYSKRGISVVVTNSSSSFVGSSFNVGFDGIGIYSKDENSSGEGVVDLGGTSFFINSGNGVAHYVPIDTIKNDTVEFVVNGGTGILRQFANDIFNPNAKIQWTLRNFSYAILAMCNIDLYGEHDVNNEGGTFMYSTENITIYNPTFITHRASQDCIRSNNGFVKFKQFVSAEIHCESCNLVVAATEVELYGEGETSEIIHRQGSSSKCFDSTDLNVNNARFESYSPGMLKGKNVLFRDTNFNHQSNDGSSLFEIGENDKFEFYDCDFETSGLLFHGVVSGNLFIEGGSMSSQNGTLFDLALGDGDMSITNTELLISPESNGLIISSYDSGKIQNPKLTLANNFVENEGSLLYIVGSTSNSTINVLIEKTMVDNLESGHARSIEITGYVTLLFENNIIKNFENTGSFLYINIQLNGYSHFIQFNSFFGNEYEPQKDMSLNSNVIIDTTDTVDVFITNNVFSGFNGGKYLNAGDSEVRNNYAFDTLNYQFYSCENSIKRINFFEYTPVDTKLPVDCDESYCSYPSNDFYDSSRLNNEEDTAGAVVSEYTVECKTGAEGSDCLTPVCDTAYCCIIGGNFLRLKHCLENPNSLNFDTVYIEGEDENGDEFEYFGGSIKMRVGKVVNVYPYPKHKVSIFSSFLVDRCFDDMEITLGGFEENTFGINEINGEVLNNGWIDFHAGLEVMLQSCALKYISMMNVGVSQRIDLRGKSIDYFGLKNSNINITSVKTIISRRTLEEALDGGVSIRSTDFTHPGIFEFENCEFSMKEGVDIERLIDSNAMGSYFFSRNSFSSKDGKQIRLLEESTIVMENNVFSNIVAENAIVLANQNDKNVTSGVTLRNNLFKCYNSSVELGILHSMFDENRLHVYNNIFVDCYSLIDPTKNISCSECFYDYNFANNHIILADGILKGDSNIFDQHFYELEYLPGYFNETPLLDFNGLERNLHEKGDQIGPYVCTDCCEPCNGVHTSFGDLSVSCTCLCEEGYDDTDKEECEPVCEGDDKCDTNAQCMSPGKCKCLSGYIGGGFVDDCEPTCEGGCPNNSTCIDVEICQCDEGFVENNLNGSCVKEDESDDDDGDDSIEDDDGSNAVSNAWIVAPIIGGIAIIACLIVIVVVVLILITNYRNRKKRRNILSVDEVSLESGVLSVRKDSFKLEEISKVTELKESNETFKGSTKSIKVVAKSGKKSIFTLPKDSNLTESLIEELRKSVDEKEMTKSMKVRIGQEKDYKLSQEKVDLAGNQVELDDIQKISEVESSLMITLRDQSLIEVELDNIVNMKFKKDLVQKMKDSFNV